MRTVDDYVNYIRLRLFHFEKAWPHFTFTLCFSGCYCWQKIVTILIWAVL